MPVAALTATMVPYYALALVPGSNQRACLSHQHTITQTTRGSGPNLKLPHNPTWQPTQSPLARAPCAPRTAVRRPHSLALSVNGVGGSGAKLLAAPQFSNRGPHAAPLSLFGCALCGTLWRVSPLQSLSRGQAICQVQRSCDTKFVLQQQAHPTTW